MDSNYALFASDIAGGAVVSFAYVEKTHNRLKLRETG
jgi:hypothetical protein